jgi:uncharacterized protein YkwD
VSILRFPVAEEDSMKRWYLLVALSLAVLALIRFELQAQEKKPFEMSKAEKELVELTNAERKKNDLPPLKPGPRLFEAARKHSENMAKQKKLDHFLDKKSPFERIKATGYQYYYAGENIAMGNLTLPQVMKGWMDSETHRKNILKTNFTEIGIGLAVDDAGDTWYTQVFGNPRP